MRIYARWTDGDWYPGEADDVSVDPVEVAFDDGTVATTPRSDVTCATDPADDRGGTLVLGGRVQAEWSDGKRYPGRLVERFGRLWNVEYDDGGSMWLTAARMTPIEAPKIGPTPDLTGYLERVKALVATLRADPQIRVTHYHVRPPATEEMIRAVEDRVGHTLAPAIRTFYLQCNGLQVRWMAVEDPGYRADRDDRVVEGEVAFQDQIFDLDATGVLNVLPIADALCDASWREIAWFDWMTDDSFEFAGTTYPELAFHQRLRIFDWPTSTNPVALVLEPGDPKVVMGDDHGASWTDSRVTDFGSYLETVLANRLSVTARREIYGVRRGHRQPPLRGIARPPVAVYAKSEGAWYPGTAVDLSTDPVEVVFDDEPPQRTPRAQVVARTDTDGDTRFAVGQVIEARWRDGAFYIGTLDDRFGRLWQVAFDDGTKSWVEASELRPAPPARVDLARGKARLADGDTSAGIAALEAAVAAEPTLREAWCEMSEAYRAQKRFDAMLEVADRWVAALPDDIQANTSRSIALQNLGRLDDALAAANHTVELAPDDSHGHYQRACVLAVAGRADDAVAAVARTLELDPETRAELRADADLAALRGRADFDALTRIPIEFPPGVPVPALLDELKDLELDLGGAFLSGTFELTQRDWREALLAWGLDESHANQLAMFGHDGMDSMYGLWLRDGHTPSECPVVYLSSEGETAVLAANVGEFAALLGLGYDCVGMTHEWERERPEESPGLVRFRALLASRRLDVPSDPNAIVARANERFPGFAEWVAGGRVARS